MTIAFMPFFSIIIYQLVSRKTAIIIFPFLTIIGVFIVLYWVYTETISMGDLRLYIIVQFTPLIVIPLILLLHSGALKDITPIIYALFFYVLAKVFEHFDAEIFFITNELISGHTIKHILASLSVYFLYLYSNLNSFFIKKHEIFD